MKLESFSHRLRATLETKKLTQAELAERADLDSSLISKLLTDTDASRRDPRVEHIVSIARALGMTPRELVVGTTAEPVLGEWVPRDELARESEIRAQAQARATNLETNLLATKAELAAMQEEVSALSRRLGDLETASQRLRIALHKTEAALAATVSERNNAVNVATEGQAALATAKSRLLQAQREISAAQGAASAGWITAVVGTLGGIALGAASGDRPRKRRDGT